MIQLPRVPALSCSRPATARKSARPNVMSSSDAPAALAALKNIFRRKIRLAVDAERHDAFRAGDAAPIAGVGVIRVDDGGAFRAQAGHGFALALRDAVQI